MNAARRVTSRGFTLIEVLIALAVVALAVGALLGTITSAASNITYLKDKTQAEWVALNRLTEVRISQNMPDPGKRTGNTVMGGMRWQWEEEVVELPVKGMFRVDVRARPTGENVDDTRESVKATAQKDSESTSAGSDVDKLNWTTTVTGVVGRSRSPRTAGIGAPFRGNLTGTPNNPGGPGGTPNAPGTGTPGNPAGPGSPNGPGNPGTPRKPQPTDR